MKPDYVLCDVCKAIISSRNQSIFFSTGRELDPSGNSHETTGREADLCGECAIVLLARLHVSPPSELGSFAFGKCCLDHIDVMAKAREKK